MVESPHNDIPPGPGDGGNASFFGRRLKVQSPTEALQPQAAPPPPRPAKRPSQRRPTLSALSGFISFLLLFLLGGLGGLAYIGQQNSAKGPLAGDKVVMIPRGADGADIIQQLESEGVVSSGAMLNAALWMQGARSKLRSGEYMFRKEASLRDVIDTLVAGREILHSVTIPEGLTSEQVVQRLRDNEFLSGELNEIPKEGTLLPDTYRISRGMARADLVRKMQDEQKKVLDQLWARRIADLPVRSPYEMLTLASIVEKETGKADERPRVASVFINRLQKRMRLQSDPTIVYGLVGGKGTLGRGILRSELERATPYNTYAIEGLPPGPIANPGRAAIEAVARPSRTKDLYFVADGSGGHVFAETLDQHSRNVVRWRQVEKDAKERQHAPASAPVDRAPDDANAPPVSPLPASPAPALAPLRGQRGDLLLSDPTFGALPTRLANDEADPVAAAPAQAVAVENAAAARPPQPNPQAKTVAAEAIVTVANRFDTGKQLDTRILAEFTPPQSTPVDGAATGEAGGHVDMAMVPVSAKRRAEQKASAARYGVSAREDSLPISEASEAPGGHEAAPALPPTPKVIRIYDASEGTALDPLRDKSWDLTTAKDVPTLQAQVATPTTKLRQPVKKPPSHGHGAAPSAQ